MEYRRFILGDLETNGYIVWSGSKAGVIDPAIPDERLITFLKESNLELCWIVNTHGHGDHIGGNALLHQRYGAPIMIHAADRAMLLSATANFSVFFGTGIISPDAAKTLENGDTVMLGEEKLQVIATPGHTRGGISLYTSGLLFSGDNLFHESIGRSDFPGGDGRLLVESIRERLLTLPAETQVLPGHGRATTIGHEIRFNPYLGGVDAL